MLQDTSRDSHALARVLANDPGVHPDYSHIAKHVRPGEPLERETAILKWYSIAASDRGVPAPITSLARAQVEAAPLDARGLGFVMLHRCGDSFYFLLICTWRNENELWKTVWYKDGDGMPAFEPFPEDGPHRPAFCVWELAAVSAEQQAWTRFLRTARDQAAAAAWLRDTFEGEAP